MRKRKLSFQELSNLTGGYVRFRRQIVSGVKGYSYFFDRKLTDKEKEVINSYQNTRLGSWSALYAPEISNDGVFLGDKCF